MEFLLVLVVFPLLSFLFGIVGQLFLKRIYLVVAITFAVWLVATFTAFNETFLIWVFIYSALALAGALLARGGGRR